MSEVRIDRVKAGFYRNGVCEACGKWAERQATFTGLTFDDCKRQADAWESRPIRHRRCEHITPPP